VDLAHLGLADDTRPRPKVICSTLNERLRQILPPQAMLAAIRWTARGNLVITGAPSATPHTLQIAAPHISTIFTQAFQIPSDKALPAARPNVKWSKISINGVPTSVSNMCSAYTFTENHDSLKLNNPAYAALLVTQRPGWVCPPTSYTTGSISSLSLAFEDPDGSKLRTILAEHYLYIHSHRATICKWKYRQPICKGTAKDHATQHTMDGNTAEDDEEDVEIQLEPAPPTANLPPSKQSITSKSSQAATSTPPPAQQRHPPPCNAKNKTATRTK
jgi:hypothetical protein